MTSYYENPTPQRAARIAKMNDRVRTHLPYTLPGARVNLSEVVHNIAQQDRPRFLAIVKAVKDYEDFNSSNDPHGEHDRGTIELDGSEFMFKFDYYDRNLEYGSENPDKPEETTYVLTIMHAYEA